MQITDALKSLKSFISPNQLTTLCDGLITEEADFFRARLVDLAETVNTMPETYGQIGKGDDAIAYLHYFIGGADWYITEKDMEDEQNQAFCLASIHEVELGYVSLIELTSNNAELDLFFTPTPVGILKERLSK